MSLTIDSHGNSQSNNGVSTTVAVSAAAAGEIIVIGTYFAAKNNGAPLTDITATSATLAWVQIGKLAGSNAGGLHADCVAAWYAITTGPVVAELVLLTSTLNPVGPYFLDAVDTVFASYSGPDASPLDSILGVTPVTHAQTANAALSQVVSTGDPATIVMALIASAAPGFGLPVTPTAGAAQLEGVSNGGGIQTTNLALVTQAFAAAQAGITFGASSSGATWVYMAFAIKGVGTAVSHGQLLLAGVG